MPENLKELFVRLTANTENFTGPINAAAAAQKAMAATMVESGEKFSAAAQQIIGKQELANVALAKSQAVLEELKKAFDAGSISAETLARASESVQRAMKAAGDSAQEAVSGFQKFAEGIGEFIENPLHAAGEATKSFLMTLGPMGTVTLGAGVAVAALGERIAELVLEEGAAAKETQNLADRLNLSFEQTKKLGEMAQVSGVSIDVLQRVSMRLADALTDSDGAGKKVALALDGMGIAASNSGDLLLKVLQHLAEIPDATTRISEAHTIMGKGAVQLEPLLKNYERLSEAIEQLGGQLDTEMVGKLLKANEAAKLAGVAWDHFKESLAVTFSPVVTAGLEMLSRLLSGPPTLTLDKQIQALQGEIASLEGSARQATVAVTSMMGGGFTSTAATAQLIAQKQALLDVALGQKQAAEWSKDYNDAVDKSNRAAVLSAQAAKEAYAAAEEQLREFNNSIVNFFGLLPTTYEAYADKLSEGGKTAKAALGDITGALSKVDALAAGLSGDQLDQLGHLTVQLLKLRDTAKAFADTDAFNVAAVKIGELVDKFPAQVQEISAMDAGLGQFFADMVAGAAAAPDALNKIDITSLAAKVLEAQKQLDEQAQKMGQTFTKAWEAYETGVRKATGAGQDLRGSLEDARSEAQKLDDIPLAARLPAALNAAYEATIKWADALHRSGIDADGTTQKLADLDTILADQRTTLAQGEAEWAHVSSTVNKLAQTDLPAAIKAEQEYIDFLKQHGAAAGQVYAEEIRLLTEVIKQKELSGKDATAEIIQLEQKKIATQALIEATTNLGNVYVGLRKDFDTAFAGITKGIADNLVEWNSWSDTLTNIGKTLAKNLLDTLLTGLFAPLKAELDQTGGLFDTLSKKLTAGVSGLTGHALSIPGIPHSSVGASGGSGEVASEGGSLPGGVVESGVGVGSGEVSGGGGSIGSGLTSLAGLDPTGVAQAAISAIQGVVQGFQMERLANLLGEIEISTRQTKEQLTGGIQYSLNTYLPELKHLTDIWGELVNGHLAKIQDVLWWGVVNVNVANLKLDGGANPLGSEDFSWSQKQLDDSNAASNLATGGQTGQGGTPVSGGDQGGANPVGARTPRANSDLGHVLGTLPRVQPTPPNVAADPNGGYQLKPGESFIDPSQLQSTKTIPLTKAQEITQGAAFYGASEEWFKAMAEKANGPNSPTNDPYAGYVRAINTTPPSQDARVAAKQLADDQATQDYKNGLIDLTEYLKRTSVAAHTLSDALPVITGTLSQVVQPGHPIIGPTMGGSAGAPLGTVSAAQIQAAMGQLSTQIAAVSAARAQDQLVGNLLVAHNDYIKSVVGWFNASYGGNFAGKSLGQVSDADIQAKLDLSGSTLLGTTVADIRNAVSAATPKTDQERMASYLSMDHSQFQPDPYKTRSYSQPLPSVWTIFVHPDGLAPAGTYTGDPGLRPGENWSMPSSGLPEMLDRMDAYSQRSSGSAPYFSSPVNSSPSLPSFTINAVKPTQRDVLAAVGKGLTKLGYN